MKKYTNMKFNVIIQNNPSDPSWVKEFGAFLREIKEEGFSTQNACVIECEPEDTNRITAIVKKHHLRVGLVKQQDSQQDNEKKCKCSLLFVLIAALLLPVILNFVVGLEQPNDISVVGTPEIWIGFYGSYLGGVATAMIGFLTLYQTSKNSKRELLVAYQRTVIERLEQTLAQCVSLFDFSRLCTISLYFNNPDKYDEVLQKLDEYYRHVLTVANAWGVIYDGNEKTEVKNFQNIYHRCVKELIEYINDVSKAIVRLKDSSKEEQPSAVSDIKVILEKEAEYNCLLHELFEKAKFWLASERTELQRLQR